MEFVAAPVRQRKPVVALADAGEFGRQVGQLLRDEMDDVPFPLDAALRGEHARREDNAALALIERRQITKLATPVSSSMVMNMTPFADPGFCRTSTRPAVVSHLPSRALMVAGDRDRLA
jgi:hypothetical protein